MQRTQIVDLIVDRLEGERANILSQWQAPVGTTTRHFYVDNFLPIELADEAYNAYPRDGSGFFSKETFREKKRTSAHLSEYAPILADLTYAMQDPAVVAKVADIVGFTQIEPDPSLYAGGLSMMFKGDFLNPHIDNSHDAKRDRYRRLNLLYYVSPDWAMENGGNFELWNDDCSMPVTIISQQNRLLVMETNKTSWHSVSPVQVDRPRCCVSNYYFSTISPDATDYFHVTSFTGRPDETVKKIVGVADNALRNMVSKTLGVGRGKKEINSDPGAGPNS
ncbi:2OG-Fe(II) oxygenase [Bradyrhizobium genosp. L]|uniref:2OG-Fe(II) oxygenase n=1 Tax=Bradyrhizobium genosp. L TaxID=83637 RepID=UPI0018A2DB65|nr:2OG-Fe(II) oxygenase [Bradyrhizobium genosp. L]QPF82964.1 2OG-Fe(II) oxygenase [Bradyrhizobium genosp. L]